LSRASDANFSPIRAPAFGGFDLDVDAYGLDPDLNYTVTFSAPGVNDTTNSLTVPVNFTVAGYKQVERTRVRVLGWEYPLATSIATLHEILPSGGLHEIPVIIPDGEVNATVHFEFTQILNGKSHTNIPPVGCRGACWPYQFSAYGKGFLTTGEKVGNFRQHLTALYPPLTLHRHVFPESCTRGKTFLELHSEHPIFFNVLIRNSCPRSSTRPETALWIMNAS